MVIIILGFAITIFSIYYVRYIEWKKPDYVFSFEDTMGTRKVPVVSFRHNNETVNFIIDSGASHSIINYSSIDKFNYTLIEDTNGTVYGLDGNKIQTKIVSVEITKNGHVFNDLFQVLPVPGIDKVNSTEGIEIHGLLGSEFLKKYQFLINFKSLKAYTNG